MSPSSTSYSASASQHKVLASRHCETVRGWIESVDTRSRHRVLTCWCWFGVRSTLPTVEMQLVVHGENMEAS